MQARRSSIEKDTLTPFSYRGSGSAFRSQYTCWRPAASRLLALAVVTLVPDGRGGDVTARVGVVWGAAAGFAAFLRTGYVGLRN